MLQEYLLKTKFGKYLPSINSFFRSKLFISIVCIFDLIAVCFGLEIPLFICIVLTGIFICLTCDDLLGTMPMVMIGYMTISRKNNPIDNPNTIYKQTYFWVIMIILIVLIVSLYTARIIYNIKNNKIIRKKPKLLYGFIAFSVCLIIGGIGTEMYTLKSVAYGLLVALSLCGFYFIFYYTVDWKNVKADYFAEMVLIIGLMMIIQVSYMYIFYRGPEGPIDRYYLRLGWGINNNVGAVIGMCIPAGFYLSINKKHGYIYSILANLIFIATLFTQSRNAILVSSFYYVGCTVLSIVLSKKNRIKNLIVSLSALVVFAIILLFAQDSIQYIFKSMLDRGLSDNGRFDYYKAGFNAFKYNPITGTGFFDYKHSFGVYFGEETFMPPRYHSTIIQLIASTGIIGFVAYSFHRIETIKLIFKKLNTTKLFIGLTISIILVNSLLDCMFFNIGPGLHYACLLALLEGISINEEEVIISNLEQTNPLSNEPGL